MKKIILILLILILVFVLSSCGLNTEPMDSANTELQTVVIESGSTAVSIGEQLQNEGIDYEIKVCDSPHELRSIIVEKNKATNKARILAGYCWNWISEGKNKIDTILHKHFTAKGSVCIFSFK